MSNSKDAVKLDNANLSNVEVVDLEAAQKKKLTLLAVTSAAVATILLLSGSAFLVWRNVNDKNMKMAYDSAYEQLQVQVDKSAIEIEIGKELSYTPGKPREIIQLPDEITSHITKYPKGANIYLSSEQRTSVGDYSAVLNLEIIEPNYNQTVTRTQKINVSYVDNTEPVIELDKEYVFVQEEQQVYDNVLSVTDEVFGAYKMSVDKENHTYYVDITEIDFEKDGEYAAKVVVNDNGKTREKTFTVKVNKDELKKKAAEEAKKEKSND